MSSIASSIREMGNRIAIVTESLRELRQNWSSK